MNQRIVPIDPNARIVFEFGNYTLQYRRNSKRQISWRRAGYFPDLTSLCLEYLKNAPARAGNPIRSIQELIKVIRKAESNIINLFTNNKKL